MGTVWKRSFENSIEVKSQRRAVTATGDVPTFKSPHRRRLRYTKCHRFSIEVRRFRREARSWGKSGRYRASRGTPSRTYRASKGARLAQWEHSHSKTLACSPSAGLQTGSSCLSTAALQERSAGRTSGRTGGRTWGGTASLPCLAPRFRGGNIHP